MSEKISQKEFELLKDAMERAYVPYSKFRVGALLLTEDGEYFQGCNIENASYPLCNCAERTAIFKAISDKKTKFKKLFVISDADRPCAPCGACRQVISEFCEKTMPIILTDLEGKIKETTISELLPYAFGPKDLE